MILATGGGTLGQASTSQREAAKQCLHPGVALPPLPPAKERSADVFLLFPAVQADRAIHHGATLLLQSWTSTMLLHQTLPNPTKPLHQ